MECVRTGIKKPAKQMWRARMVTDIPDNDTEYWQHFAAREVIDEWLDDPGQNIGWRKSRDGTTRRERLIRIEPPREVIE